MAKTKLPRLAGPGMDSALVVVRKRRRVVASWVRWMWIRLPGAWGSGIESSVGWVEEAPFVAAWVGEAPAAMGCGWGQEWEWYIVLFGDGDVRSFGDGEDWLGFGRAEIR